MKCPTCKEELIPYGETYIRKKDGKYKRYFGWCNRHIPYTTITLMKEEFLEE